MKEAPYSSIKDTQEHINTVRKILNILIKEIEDRAVNHDYTKTVSPELEYFDEFTPKLKHTTYGSPEYMGFLKELKPALDHHYANNRHHPEHFKNGIEDMSLIDIIEMFCDWKASSMRHLDGNLRKSIEINSDRYKINPQLTKILLNSMDLIDIPKNKL